MASIKTLAELYAYFETGDKPTQAQFEDLIYTMFNGLSTKPKVYRALLTQAGTDDPSVVILENTLGGIPTVTYSSDGNYFITLVGKWTSNKTGIFTAQLNAAIFSALILDNDTIIISTQDISTGTPIAFNGLLNNSLIEITVYP